MTSNQIAWLNYHEQERANKAKEAEALRSNLAREGETIRSNLINENLRGREAQIAEERSKISQMEAITNRFNAETRRREQERAAEHLDIEEVRSAVSTPFEVVGKLFSIL